MRAPGSAGSSEAPPALRDTVLDIEGADVDYRSKSGPVKALSDLSLQVERNAFVSVIGPSGCGKTTLLKIVSRVLKVTRGKVRIDGQPIEEVDLTGRLSYVFQRPLLLPWRSALANVMLPLEVLRKRTGDADKLRAENMLKLTGLEQFIHSAPHELSGGMQQRVALARALVVEPEILLMDEPFSALDEITREVMQEELLRIWQQTRNTILFITHNIEEAVLLSDRVVALSKRPGTVLADIDVGIPRPRPEAIRDDPRYRDIVKELRGLLKQPEGVRV